MALTLEVGGERGDGRQSSPGRNTSAMQGFADEEASSLSRSMVFVQLYFTLECGEERRNSSKLSNIGKS